MFSLSYNIKKGVVGLSLLVFLSGMFFAIFPEKIYATHIGGDAVLGHTDEEGGAIPPTFSASVGGQSSQPTHLSTVGSNCGAGSGVQMQECLLLLMNVVAVGIPHYFLAAAGFVFDALIAAGLSSDLLHGGDLVEQGWTAVRDIVNSVFIFILIYIAIATILQLAGGQTKRMLVQLIIVALLLNFSLYITRFVVDVSNVIALRFYDAISAQSPETGKVRYGTTAPKVLSQGFMNAINHSPLYADLGIPGTNRVGGHATVFAFVFIVNMIAIWMFFVVSLLFLGRVIALWLIMIFSPIAFAAWIIPGGKGLWNKWLHHLTHQAFFAPLFLFLLYLLFVFLQTPLMRSFSGSLSEGPDTLWFDTILGVGLRMGLIVVFMFLIVKISREMAEEAGSKAVAVGAWIGGKTLGVGARGMRRSGGWAADNFLKSQMAGRMRSSVVGRVALKPFEMGAKGTWDPRNIPGAGGYIADGKGIKGGYKEIAGAQQKTFDDTLAAQRTPAAKAALLANAGGKAFGSFTSVERDNAIRNMSMREYLEVHAAATPLQQAHLKAVREKISEGFTEEKRESDDRAERTHRVDARSRVARAAIPGHLATIDNAETTPAARETALNDLRKDKALLNAEHVARLDVAHLTNPAMVAELNRRDVEAVERSGMEEGERTEFVAALIASNNVSVLEHLANNPRTQLPNRDELARIRARIEELTPPAPPPPAPPAIEVAPTYRPRGGQGPNPPPPKNPPPAGGGPTIIT